MDTNQTPEEQASLTVDTLLDIVAEMRRVEFINNKALIEALISAGVSVVVNPHAETPVVFLPPSFGPALAEVNYEARNRDPAENAYRDFFNYGLFGGIKLGGMA